MSAKRAPKEVGFPQLKKRCRALTHLLVTLGHEALDFSLRPWRTPEPAKPALRKSFWIALSRCAVHLIPMLALSVLIALNLHTYYIGPTFHGALDDAFFLAALQLAAKVTELLCVASLSTIVLQVLRHELLGEGVPIGLLGAGIAFSQAGMFVSPEFLAALSFSFRSWSRFRFLLVLILAGAIALTIGPAAAILMLPRQQLMPIANTRYFLDGSASHFWPKFVSHEIEPAFCSQSNATKYAVCPSGGFESIRSGLSTINFTNLIPANQDPGLLGVTSLITTGGFLNTDSWPWSGQLIRSPQWLSPATIASLTTRGIQNQTTVMQPHMASVIVVHQLLSDFRKAAEWSGVFNRSSILDSINDYTWAQQFAAQSHTTQPLARVRCNDFAETLDADSTEVHFPFMILDGTNATNWDDVVKNKPFSMPLTERNATSHIRVQWASLPPQDFGVPAANVSVNGIMIELPWKDDSVRLTISCTIMAEWHSEPIVLDTQSAYSSWRLQDGSQNLFDPKAPNTPIDIDTSWLDLLWPRTSTADSSADGEELNALEQMLEEFGYSTLIAELRSSPQMLFTDGTHCALGMIPSYRTDVDVWNDQSCQKGRKTQFIEVLIAAMLADGLSRIGSWRQFNTSTDNVSRWQINTLPTNNDYYYRLLHGLDAVQLPTKQQASVIQSLSMSIGGWSYNASANSDYLAITVAAIYLLFAAAHTLSTLRHRVTSSAWHNLTELLMLCYNSPQPRAPALRNTSCGIKSMGTYAQRVSVRAAEPSLGDDSEGDIRSVWLVTNGDECDTNEESTTVIDEETAGEGRIPDGVSTAANKIPYSDGAVALGIASANATAITGSAETYHAITRRNLHRVEVDELYG